MHVLVSKRVCSILVDSAWLVLPHALLCSYFGPTCASGITWAWTSKYKVKLTWNIAQNWHGKARISRWADAARKTSYSNGMNGNEYYRTDQASGTYTNSVPNSAAKYFVFEESLGNNEFGTLCCLFGARACPAPPILFRAAQVNPKGTKKGILMLGHIQR